MEQYGIIKAEITKRGLTQNRLALEAKISPANFSQAINGKMPMFPAWRKRICEFLEVPENELFKEEE